MKVTLSEGNWADIRDPRTLNERQTARLEDAQLAAMEHIANPADFEHIQDLSPLEQIRSLGREGAKAMREMKWETILVYVSEWSYGAVTEEVLLEELPSVDVAALFDQISKVVKATGGPKINAEPNPDPNSPMPPLEG
ncbi:hypothetical protein ACFVUS_12515 [Nocardia sp. NPDC058058]|uniref:hypothetical protein n=1 Tax=Nocardia sp. NPDC058058 TaxID=3346317 RepID=UPI0036DE534F